MDNQRSSWLAFYCAATVLVSAFLLFQVQPIISKMILPWFGGSPAVWTTCMLFFQVMLLAGYAYAHWLARRPLLKTQAVLHAVLLILALGLLPITPEADWKPIDSQHPTQRILLLLGAHVALPFLALAATAPLIQYWFSRAYPGRSPYRLYALSNAGSLAALLTYPFLVEPSLTTVAQGWSWAAGFALFAVLCGIVAWRVYRLPNWASDTSPKAEPEDSSAMLLPEKPEGKPTASRPPRGREWAAWILLPAFASMMLLAVTNHVCQDVAVVPFLWIVPLSLYLLSFIICFDGPRWYSSRVYSLLTAILVLLVCVAIVDYRVDSTMESLGWDFQLTTYTNQLTVEAGLFLAMLFSLCMLCHGELVQRKPAPEHLTSFYLCISAGGALGGLFVAVIAPTIFNNYLELNFGLIVAFLLAGHVLWTRLQYRMAGAPSVLQFGLMIVFTVGLLAVFAAQMDAFYAPGMIAQQRNFYGRLRVFDINLKDYEFSRRSLYNGRILHGLQYYDESRKNRPVSYYKPESGVARAILGLQARQPSVRVGVVGLGTGMLAAFGREGDYFRFYEINPDVIEIANEYFTYLKDSRARHEIALGDARLTLEREPPQNFDILILDAFSGDAIPAHLLTVEAFAIYRRHVRPGGIIAVHISNRHLNLQPVVAGIAEHYDLAAFNIYASENSEVPGDAGSDWVLLSDDPSTLKVPEIADWGVELDMSWQLLWTDQYSNLFQIME